MNIMNRRAILKAGIASACAAVLPLQKVAPADRDWSGKQPVAYPDPAVEVLDNRFRRYGPPPTAGVERLATGFRFTEGPCWFGDGRHLLFTDIPGNRILKWTEDSGQISTFREPANHANGLTRDRQGRLITCEHGTRRVTRTEYDGTVTVLIDKFEGKRLNSPNDVVVHPDGGIWFTDPDYGIQGDYSGTTATSELPERVYRLDPQTAKAQVVADDPVKPNGLCFSPDHSLLYVADSKFPPKEIFVYDVANTVRLSKARVFVKEVAGLADGIRCDIHGNVWASAGWRGPESNGVHVYAPEGVLIGKIHLPEVCANLCFGGPKRNRLFMTGSQSLYAIYVKTQGAPVS
jgi:gluconolactonase